MKKKLLLPIFIFLSLFSFSADDPFDIDIEAIENEFEILDEFEENYLKSNVSLHDLEINGRNSGNKKNEIKKEFEFVKRAENTVSGVPANLQSFLLGPVSVVLETVKSRNVNPIVLIVVGGIVITAGALIIIYATSYDYSGECVHVVGEACTEIAIEVLIDACIEACSSSSIF